MPNNPGRIDGDYSIGEKEEIKYIDPGNFGAMRKESKVSMAKIYILVIGIAFAALIMLIIFGLIS
jgi:hypothetical protein